MQALSDTYAALDGPELSVYVCGGAGLLFLKLIDRPTQDIDLLGPPDIPDQFWRAAALTAKNFGLPVDWINTSPSFLWKMGLPDGFYDRCKIFKLKERLSHLKIFLSSRLDQIHFKLFAAIDELQFNLSQYGITSHHLEDLKKLNPKKNEIKLACDWCLKQEYQQDIKKTLTDLLNQEGWGHVIRKV
ncbi:MAG: hypothetical protein HQM16_13225 [Deltaproteobacteria bacterium]|nr:hypothetical protein [Deltaproteobacteria bacterium]